MFCYVYVCCVSVWLCLCFSCLCSVVFMFVVFLFCYCYVWRPKIIRIGYKPTFSKRPSRCAFRGRISEILLKGNAELIFCAKETPLCRRPPGLYWGGPGAPLLSPFWWGDLRHRAKAVSRAAAHVCEPRHKNGRLPLLSRVHLLAGDMCAKIVCTEL